MREPLRDIERLRHILEAIQNIEMASNGISKDLVHDYYQIDTDELWYVIQEDLVILKPQIENYIKELN